MPIKAGLRDAEAIIPVLDPGYADLSEAEYGELKDVAVKVAQAAFDRYEQRAKYVVMGRLHYSPKTGWVSKYEPGQPQVCLGFYATESQARAAAESMAIQRATWEHWHVWIIPYWRNTPASFGKARKEALSAAEQGPSPAEEFSHKYWWREANPDADESEYPGPPEKDLKAECPICGQTESE